MSIPCDVRIRFGQLITFCDTIIPSLGIRANYLSYFMARYDVSFIRYYLHHIIVKINKILKIYNLIEKLIFNFFLLLLKHYARIIFWN